METRVLGTSGIPITPIIMGTWQAGKRGWVGIEDSETIAAIRTAFEVGITTFDTAEIYGDGHSERIVGEALSEVREEVVLATKVFPTHLKYQQVLEACDRSLQNLKTDTIDLYQIHWPSGSFKSELVPIEETMAALGQLKQQGKIRAIGVSNFSRSQLEEATRYGRIDSVQPPYSLFWRHVAAELTPYCIEHQISILAYSSLAQGLLTGKFGPDHRFPEGDHRSSNKLFQTDNYGRVQQALKQLRPLADKYQVSLTQLALAWLIAQPQTCAIAGARSAAQVRENAGAVDFQLSTADLEAIDQIGQRVTDYLEQHPVMWELQV